MILMAIDHVRVYSGIPPGGPDFGIFFTRWVTHFCAPVFVFLSGTSAFLYWVQKGRDAEVLRNYLLSRGVILVVLELTLIRFFWTFNFDFSKFVLAGVIWMIGWCMILLAFLIHVKPKTVGILGLVLIFGQQIVGLVPSILPGAAREPFGLFWEFIYSSGLKGPDSITILYVIVPWIGVMAAGYWFGEILMKPVEVRRNWLMRIGISATAVFLIVASISAFMDTGENAPPFIIKVLNQRKYPASQLFLLMTLGPAIWLMPYVEKATSRFSQFVNSFGAVPFFYYLLHIPLIHATSLLVMAMLHGTITIEGYSTAPYTQIPVEFRWELSMLYLVFAIDVAILYFLCKWYRTYKASHRHLTILKYI